MFRIVVAFLLVLACTGGASGARDIEFSINPFCGWDGYFRPMEWTPVEVDIHADVSEPFGGTFILSAPQDGLNRLNVMRSFVLTPEGSQTLPLVTKFAFGTGRCTQEIRDQRGRTQWEQTINMWDLTSASRLLRPIQEQDLLIGVIGQPRFGLLRLPRETACRSDRGSGSVCVGRKVPLRVPWDWTGFASLDVLVLYDPDWSLLRPEQLQAMTEWVSNGGTLFVILGRHPLPPDNALVRLLPFDTGQPRQTEVPGEVLTGWGLMAEAEQTVTAWPLFARPDASLIESVRAEAGGYLYGLSYRGFGRVAVMAFDPAELGEAHTARTAEFWAAHIGLCLGDQLDARGRPVPQDLSGPGATGLRRKSIVVVRTEEEEQQGGNPNNYYRISIAQKASNQVMEHLYELAEMRPLSIWWVVLTLTALAIILGPLDYLVLKRLDRLPYTWLTSTAWIVLFTLGAYYGVQALRGGRMQMRAVSVLDGIANAGGAWGTYYCGIYSPRSADYRLEGLDERQWWSGVAPSREEMWGHQQTTAMRQIHCAQEDGANLPVSVPINIWTVQSLLTETPVEKLPFMVSVERAEDRCTIEITNTSDHPIRVGSVLLKDGYADFGPVEAHATASFERRMRPFNPWVADRTRVNSRRPAEEGPPRLIPQYPTSFQGVATDTFLAQGCFSRSLAMHAYLDLGAAVVCVQYEDAPAPFAIQDRSYGVSHIQLARMVVFPSEGS